MFKDLFLTITLCCFAFGGSLRSVTVGHRLFPGLSAMDGSWAALYAASDGRVYIGLAYHGGSGHIVYYDSKTDKMHDMGDLNQLCGQSGLRQGPQSKVHTKFGEGKDGRIYFATHGGFWWDYSRFATKDGFPGAHWLRYDPRSNRVEDLGLGVPNEGIQTGVYDPLFNRIYGLTHPKARLVYYDVASGKTVDKGRINNWDSICRSIVKDDRGNIYGSFGQGQIFKYDPRQDSVTELSVRLPIRQKGISLGRDYLKSETTWRAIVWDQQTRKFYGVEDSGTNLFSFDPHAREDGEVRYLGQLCVSEYAKKRSLPFANLALALGKDRKLYYGATTGEFDYFGSKGLTVSHLISYDLNTSKTEDLGEMVLRNGDRVIGAGSAETALDGTIYFVGAVLVRPQAGQPIEAGGQISDPERGDPYYRLALIMYKPPAH